MTTKFWKYLTNFRHLKMINLEIKCLTCSFPKDNKVDVGFLYRKFHTDCFFCLLFTSPFPYMLPKQFSISTLPLQCKQPFISSSSLYISNWVHFHHLLLLVTKEDLFSLCIFFPLFIVNIICWYMSHVGRLPKRTNVKD